MARWAFAIAFLLAAILAFAIASADRCSDFTTTRFLATVAAAGFIGAVAGTLLHDPSDERTWIPWVGAIATAAVVFVVVQVVRVLNWVEACTA